MKGALLHGKIIFNMMMKYMGLGGHLLTSVICTVSDSINVQMNSVEYTTLGMNEFLRICVKHIHKSLKQGVTLVNRKTGKWV
jgi:hypothetical protein